MSDPPPKRVKTLLRVCVATIDVRTDIIPTNFKGKQLRFGHYDCKINAVVGIENLTHRMAPPELYACLCTTLGISEDHPVYIVRDLCQGKLPDDVVVAKMDDNIYVLWFVLASDDSLLVVDIAGWDVFPRVKIIDFSCVRNSINSRVVRQTAALQDLSHSIDEAAFCLTDACSKTIYDKLKCVYDECIKVG